MDPASILGIGAAVGSQLKNLYDKFNNLELKPALFAFRAAAANLLARSDRLNRFVNRITFGRINKTEMGLALWRDCHEHLRKLPIPPDSAINTRTTRFLPLLNSILSGEKAAAENHLRLFTRDSTAKFFNSAVDAIPFRHEAAATAIIGGLLDVNRDPDTGERWLANFASRHGWKPIDAMLKHLIPQGFGRDFLLRQLSGAIKPLLQSYVDIDGTKKPFYDALSDLAAIELTGRRPPQALETTEAILPISVRVVEAIVHSERKTAGYFNQVCSLASNVYRRILGHRPEPKTPLHVITEQLLANRPNGVKTLHGICVGSAFADTVSELPLLIAAPDIPYVSAEAAINDVKEATSQARLDGLDILCEEDNELLATVTSYLDRDGVAKPLAAAALSCLNADTASTPTLHLDKTTLTLAKRDADYQFSVRRDVNAIHVTLHSRWPVIRTSRLPPPHDHNANIDHAPGAMWLDSKHVFTFTPSTGASALRIVAVPPEVNVIKDGQMLFDAQRLAASTPGSP